jgi:hypothetical protein
LYTTSGTEALIKPCANHSARDSHDRRQASSGWGRIAPYEACDEGDGVRERIAYLFMISILILLIAVTFGVLGKGEYQPPKDDQGYVSNPWPEGPSLRAVRS